MYSERVVVISVVVGEMRRVVGDDENGNVMIVVLTMVRVGAGVARLLRRFQLPGLGAVGRCHCSLLGQSLENGTVADKWLGVFAYSINLDTDGDARAL